MFEVPDTLANPFRGEQPQLLVVQVKVLDIVGPRSRRLHLLFVIVGRIREWVDRFIFNARPACVLLQGRVTVDGEVRLELPRGHVHRCGGFLTSMILKPDTAVSLAPTPHSLTRSPN